MTPVEKIRKRKEEEQRHNILKEKLKKDFNINIINCSRKNEKIFCNNFCENCCNNPISAKEIGKILNKEIKIGFIYYDWDRSPSINENIIFLPIREKKWEDPKNLLNYLKNDI